MGNKYEITLKDINQEIELLLTKLNLLIDACNNSNNIDDLFPELLAQIEKYKIDIFNYKRQDLPFVDDMNNGNPIIKKWQAKHAYNSILIFGIIHTKLFSELHYQFAVFSGWNYIFFITFITTAVFFAIYLVINWKSAVPISIKY